MTNASNTFIIRATSHSVKKPDPTKMTRGQIQAELSVILKFNPHVAPMDKPRLKELREELKKRGPGTY